VVEGWRGGRRGREEKRETHDRISTASLIPETVETSELSGSHHRSRSVSRIGKRDGSRKEGKESKEGVSSFGLKSLFPGTERSGAFGNARFAWLAFEGKDLIDKTYLG